MMILYKPQQQPRPTPHQTPSPLTNAPLARVRSLPALQLQQPQQPAAVTTAATVVRRNSSLLRVEACIEEEESHAERYASTPAFFVASAFKIENHDGWQLPASCQDAEATAEQPPTTSETRFETARESDEAANQAPNCGGNAHQASLSPCSSDSQPRLRKLSMMVDSQPGDPSPPAQAGSSSSGGLLLRHGEWVRRIRPPPVSAAGDVHRLKSGCIPS